MSKKTPETSEKKALQRLRGNLTRARWLPEVMWHSRRELGGLDDLFRLFKQGDISPYIRAYKKRLLYYEKPYAGLNHPVIVYQMMKVGSKTIRETLSPALGYRVLHQHMVFQEHMDAAFTEHRDANIPLLSKSPGFNMARARYLRSLIANNSDRRWKVIVLVRDPLARNVSLFFHRVYLFQNELLQARGASDFQKNLSRLIELFHADRNCFSYHDMMATWFDSELKRAFGVDIFCDEFGKEKGYHMYQGEHADVLLIRLEDLNRCYHEAFKTFLGVSLPGLSNMNTGHEKGYRDIYTAFKQSVTLPEDYIEKLYALRYVRHCYAPEQIRDFQKKWRTS